MNLEGLIPVRSAEDIFAGRVNLVLAGQAYVLPTLVIEEEERWLASIDGQLGSLLGGLSGKKAADATAVLGLLSGATPKLLELLYQYDQTHVLPPREQLVKLVRGHELIRAVMEVWVAANPLVGIGLYGLQLGPTNGDSPEPTSSPPMPTAGKPGKSEPS